jgi:hypothetical protein
MKKYIVEAHTDSTHQIKVGVMADSPELAKERVAEAASNGSLWADTTDMRIFEDEHVEWYKPHLVVFEPEEVIDFPEPDIQVLGQRHREAAFAACMALLSGEHEQALDLTRQAVPTVAGQPTCMTTTD